MRGSLHLLMGGNPSAGRLRPDPRCRPRFAGSRRFAIRVDSPETRFELSGDWFEIQVRGWSLRIFDHRRMYSTIGDGEQMARRRQSVTPGALRDCAATACSP
jgi:hypothetical protein